MFPVFLLLFPVSSQLYMRQNRRRSQCFQYLSRARGAFGPLAIARYYLLGTVGTLGTGIRNQQLAVFPVS